MSEAVLEQANNIIADIDKIMELLPHRYPFLLVDRVIDFKQGECLTAIKNVTFNEPFFTGHFPHRPVMPGVMILEALAQASGVFAFIETNSKPTEEGLYYLTGIDNARFKLVVRPGDQLQLRVSLLKRRREISKFLCEASVDGQLACSAEIMSIRRD